MGAAKIQMKFVHASVNPTTALFGDETATIIWDYISV